MWGGPAERQTDNEAGQEQECNGSGQAPSHRARTQVTSSVRFPHTAADNLGRPGTVSPDGKWSDIWAVRAPGSVSQHCSKHLRVWPRRRLQGIPFGTTTNWHQTFPKGLKYRVTIDSGPGGWAGLGAGTLSDPAIRAPSRGQPARHQGSPY